MPPPAPIPHFGAAIPLETLLRTSLNLGDDGVALIPGTIDSNFLIEYFTKISATLPPNQRPIFAASLHASSEIYAVQPASSEATDSFTVVYSSADDFGGAVPHSESLLVADAVASARRQVRYSHSTQQGFTVVLGARSARIFRFDNTGFVGTEAFDWLVHGTQIFTALFPIHTRSPASTNFHPITPTLPCFVPLFNLLGLNKPKTRSSLYVQPDVPLDMLRFVGQRVVCLEIPHEEPGAAPPIHQIVLKEDVLSLSGAPGPRTHLQLVPAPVLSPLTKAPTPLSLMTATHQAMLGYLAAFQVGVMHGNINPNTMLFELDDKGDLCGLLVDEDCTHQAAKMGRMSSKAWMQSILEAAANSR
ncbi:hypothetical protein MKEN_01388000 [Mycena kentingensis (nom. inval.)]|nr:hypothetical protein MKEN_01388000 [Mycena kentingensis (nom. inval.)]